MNKALLSVAAGLLLAASPSPRVEPLSSAELTALRSDPRGARLERVVATLGSPGIEREQAEAALARCYLDHGVKERDRFASRLLRRSDRELVSRSVPVALRLAGMAARRGDRARAERLARAALAADGFSDESRFVLGQLLGRQRLPEVRELARQLAGARRTGLCLRPTLDAAECELMTSARAAQLLLVQAGAPVTLSGALRRDGEDAVLALRLESVGGGPAQVSVGAPTIEDVPEAGQLDYSPPLGRHTVGPQGMTITVRFLMPALREIRAYPLRGIGGGDAVAVTQREWRPLVSLPVATEGFQAELPLMLEYVER